MGKFAKHKWWILTALLTAPLVAIAADVPNMFTTGTVISSMAVNANFKNLSDRVTALEAGKAATNYVRWGRTVCPSGANLVYSGWAAGAHYTHTGSGANTLCLATTPEWLSYDDGNQNGALIYGLEFETRAYGVAPLQGLQDLEGTCAVCEVPRQQQIMIPGKVSCPTGWTLEYNGYIMATHYTQPGKSEFVCVDAAPELAGNSANQDGDLWYPTEIECGSLACAAGGYVQDRELACAVCSK
jgi:hypothetical protein